MKNWFENHAGLASWLALIPAWLSCVIAAIAMVRSSAHAGQPVNWNMVTFRIAFLICLCAELTPALDNSVRATISGIVFFLLVAINMRTGA
jgi:hypothetical protein